MDELDSKSEPCMRVSFTIILRPNLASQALNVRSIKLIWCSGEFSITIVTGTKSTILSIIPSKQRRDIKRWLKLIIKAIIITINESIINDR